MNLAISPMEIKEIIGQKNTSVITNKLRTAKMALRIVKAKARLTQRLPSAAVGHGQYLVVSEPFSLSSCTDGLVWFDGPIG